MSAEDFQPTTNAISWLDDQRFHEGVLCDHQHWIIHHVLVPTQDGVDRRRTRVGHLHGNVHRAERFDFDCFGGRSLLTEHGSDVWVAKVARPPADVDVACKVALSKHQHLKLTGGLQIQIERFFPAKAVAAQPGQGVGLHLRLPVDIDAHEQRHLLLARGHVWWLKMDALQYLDHQPASEADLVIVDAHEALVRVR